MTSDNLDIIALNALRDNYIWTIRQKDSGQCVVVDPGEASVVLDFLKTHDYRLVAVLITHHHWDHTGGVVTLTSQFPDLQVYGPALEPVDGMSTALNDQDSVNIEPMGLNFKTLHVPGHTLGHIALYGHGIVFTGDTLFTGGCGKIFEGTKDQMFNSLNTLTQLSDETMVYCGHEYTEQNLRFALAVEPNNPDVIARMDEVRQLRSENLPTVPATLAYEKKTNPFLRTREESVIKAVQTQFGNEINNEVDVLFALRQWKNSTF